MNITKIKTRKFTPPKDNLDSLLDYIPKLRNKSIVTISSKVISICEGHTLPLDAIEYNDLIHNMSTSTLEPFLRGKSGMVLTQVGDMLIESAGVDRSNSNGCYVLLPKDSYKTARKIWELLKRRDDVHELGVVITDSRAIPGRLGAIGFALGLYGFKSANAYAGKSDVFGSAMSKVANIADSLAAAAVLMMGEGDEQTPLAVITGVDQIEYYASNVPLAVARHYSWVDPKLDVYAPLLQSGMWQKGGVKAA